MDSQAAVSILQNGSRHPHLQVEAVEMYTLCRERAIMLTVERLPRKQSELADLYSRMVDENDWMLSRWCFEWLDRHFGPHSMDCFDGSAQDAKKLMHSQRRGQGKMCALCLQYT